nr:hypothetical protein [uncultured bacterium]
MGAMRVEQPHFAAGVAKGDKVFPHQPHANRRTVRYGQFLGEQRGLPKLPEHPSHGSAWTHPSQGLIALGIRHTRSPSKLVAVRYYWVVVHGCQLRWPHRINGCVPRTASLSKTGFPTVVFRSPRASRAFLRRGGRMSSA